jgi:hypothetical protein
MQLSLQTCRTISVWDIEDFLVGIGDELIVDAELVDDRSVSPAVGLAEHPVEQRRFARCCLARVMATKKRRRSSSSCSALPADMSEALHPSATLSTNTASRSWPWPSGSSKGPDHASAETAEDASVQPRQRMAAPDCEVSGIGGRLQIGGFRNS